MSKKAYNVSTTARTARPRSKRLREIGGTSVTIVGGVGGGSGGVGAQSHTHANKTALDALSIDANDYLHVSQYREETQTVQTHKVRAGYADEAGHAATADDALRAEEAKHAKRADDADKWDGEEFTDYLDQPVRRSDKVRFGQVTTPTLTTPDFTPGGFAGAGAGLTRDANGQMTLEVDYIVARRKLHVNEVIINQSTHVGGRTLFSAANMECVRVEDGGTYWRCYFDTKNGQKANLWKKDDLAYFQQYSADNTQILRYYWRLVTSVGEDWINLSKSTCDVNSGTPAAGDNIVQVGNLTDRRRQSMLEIDMMGASRVVLYAGISTFSFVDRNEGALGVDEQGEPYFYVYGDAFIGDRNLSDPQSQYITFQTPEGETRRRMIVSADLRIGSGSTGLTNLSEWQSKQAEIDRAGQAAAQAQEKVENLQPGDRNLLLNSAKGWKNSDYNIAQINIGDYKPSEGEECTIVIKAKPGVGKEGFTIYNSGGGVFMASIPSDLFVENSIVSQTFKWCVGNSTNTTVYIFAPAYELVAESQIEWVKIVVGNKTSKIWTPAPEDVKADAEKAAEEAAEQAAGNVRTSAVNCLKDSRFDNLNWWSSSEGVVTLVEDPKFGTVVQYQRVLGSGSYQRTFEVYNRTQFANCDVIYYVIAKNISGDGIWAFGGWSETVYALDNTGNYIDLGDGWKMHWTTFKAGATIGDGTFGINSTTGTWQFYAAGVSLGKNPPSSWTIAEGDLSGAILINTKRLADWASDDIISPVEKTGLQQQRAAIEAEYAQLKAEAERYSVSTQPYEAAYNAAIAALDKYTKSSPAEISVDREEYARIAAYYTAAEGIRNEVSGVTDVSYLCKAFAKGSTDISGGVVLSEFIGIKEGEKVVAGMTKGTVNSVSVPLLFTGADDILSAMQTATWYLDKEGVQKSRNKNRTQSVTMSDGGIVFANVDTNGRETEAMSMTPELLRPTSFDKPFSDPNVGLIAEPAGNRSMKIPALSSALMEGRSFSGTNQGSVGDELNPAISVYRRMLNVELGSSAEVSISKFTITLNLRASGGVWISNPLPGCWEIQNIQVNAILRVRIALINRNTGITKYLYDKGTSESRIDIPALSCTDLARGSYDLYIDICAPRFFFSELASNVTTSGNFSLTESQFTASWSGGACNSKIFGNGFLFSKTSNNYCGIIGDERNFVFEQRAGNYGFRADNTGSKIWCAARNEWIPADRVLYKGWVKGAGQMGKAWAYKGIPPVASKLHSGAYEVDLKNPYLEAITHYMVRCTGIGGAYPSDNRYAGVNYNRGEPTARNGVFNIMTVRGNEQIDGDFFFEVVDTSDLKA